MQAADRPNALLASSGLFLILAPIFLRAMSAITPLPYWDFDPLIYEASMVGIGPAGSLACDVLVLLGAGLVVLGAGLWVLGRLPGINNLPGNFQFQVGGVTCFVPLAATLLLSVLLTIVINVLLRLFQK